MKLSLILLLLLLNYYGYSQNLRVFFGNLHSHTSYSDGSATPEKAYKHARDVAKIDFLAITEHNHPEAGRIAEENELYSGADSASLISTAKRFNQDSRFVALYGQEFSSIGSGNHANIFEINAVINSAEVPNGRWDLLLNDFLPLHMDAQGRLPIMLLNHPSISNSPDHKEYGRDDFRSFDAWIKTLNKYASLINLINGPSHEINKPPGIPSEKEFLRYLNLGLHVAPTADQDNHLENWGSAANTRTAVITASLTKRNILDALRLRHVYATQDKNLSVIATFNGHLIGSIITGSDLPEANKTLDIELNIKDDDEPHAFYTVDFYRDDIGGVHLADVIDQVQFSGDTVLRIQSNKVRYTGGNQYFFIKITQSDDDGVLTDNAWLAPVWMEPDTTNPAPLAATAVTLTVNEQTEEAQITNIGSSEVNLKNWVLISTVGNQRFTFSASRVLKPGQSIVVTSGVNASSVGNRILWTTNFIWSNSGDPGKLIDEGGHVRATTSN